MKAYVVYDKNMKTSLFTWAETPGKAKMKLSLDYNFLDIRVKRIKVFDNYENTGVPIKLYLNEGWSLPCRECGELFDRHDIEEGLAYIEEGREDFVDGTIICQKCKKKKNGWFQFIFNRLR